MEFTDLHPAIRVAAMVALMLLLIPLAMKSGKAKADRMRGLSDDLKHGRLRGIAILAVVAGIVIMASLTRS